MAPFAVGSLVEVTSDEVGFEGSWYEATVTAISRTPLRYSVVYDTLLDDSPGEPQPLREDAKRRYLRPRPTWAPGGDGWLFVGMLVEARHNDGWWVGRVSQMDEEEERFIVWFPCSDERIEFGKRELRRHMVWERGRWEVPDPKNYESLPEWKNHLPFHPKEKHKEEAPQESERGDEQHMTVTAFAEEPNFAEDILNTVQPTSQAVSFNRTVSSASEPEQENVSMKLQSNQTLVSANKVNAKVTSDGSPRKRNPKMRLLKSLVLRDFVMRMEQELEREPKELQESFTEASKSVRNGMETVGKQPSGRKRLHGKAFYGTDENMVFHINLSKGCFSDDVQTSPQLAGTTTPMLVEKKKLKPPSLSSPIHDFKIRNVVEMSSGGLIDPENPIGLVATTDPNGCSSRRQEFPAVSGFRGKRKRKRLFPRRIHCPQEGTKPRRGRPPKLSKDSNPPALPSVQSEKLSPVITTLHRQKLSIPQPGRFPQKVVIEGFRQRGRPPKLKMLPKFTGDCTIEGCLSAMDAKPKWKRSQRKGSAVALKHSRRPRRTFTSPTLFDKCSMEGAQLDRRESFPCPTIGTENANEESDTHVLDQFDRELCDGSNLEQQNHILLGSVTVGGLGLGYTIRASQKERTKVAARQAHCSPMKVNDQDILPTRRRGQRSGWSKKKSEINILPGNVNSKGCERPDCEDNLPLENCHVMEQNCSTPSAFLDGMREGKSESCQSADVGDINPSVQNANGTSGGRLMETNEVGQMGHEGNMLISGSVSTAPADKSIADMDAVMNADDSPFAEEQSAFHICGNELCLPSDECELGEMRQNANESTNRELELITLPFVKTSPLWDSLQLLEVFKARDQQPHFRPLELCRFEYREGNAIGLMVSFAGFIDSILKLNITDSLSTLEEKIACLEDFEDYGFDVGHLRQCLEDMLRIKIEDCSYRGKESELQSQIADKEDEMRGIDSELDSVDKEVAELERAMETLRERHEWVMQLRVSTESEVVRLKEDMLAVKHGCLSCEASFKNRVGSLGKQA